MFGMRADKSCLDFGLITFFFILFSLQSVAISQTGNFPPTERTENDPKWKVADRCLALTCSWPLAVPTSR